MSNFAIKLVAIIAMIVDHAGLAFYNDLPRETYYIMRYVGRLAFPLFCFLIALGFIHTHNVKKYLTRLLIFAIISEAAFDWFHFATYFETSLQNVFLTLSFGLVALCAYEYFCKKSMMPLALLTVAICAVAAEFLNTDYGWYGVTLIFILYALRNRTGLKMLFAALTMCASALWFYYTAHHNDTFMYVTFAALLALPIIYSYNGKRGYSRLWLQWAFYVFYPAHMVVLRLVM